MGWMDGWMDGRTDGWMDGSVLVEDIVSSIKLQYPAVCLFCRLVKVSLCRYIW